MFQDRGLSGGRFGITAPKGPCAQIVCTLALKHLYRDYLKATVYTIQRGLKV